MDTHHETIDTCHADHARLTREVRGAWDRSQLTVDERIWSCPTPECGEAACGLGHDHTLTTTLDIAARRLIDARHLARLGEPERASMMLALAQGHLTTVTDALGQAAVAQ